MKNIIADVVGSWPALLVMAATWHILSVEVTDSFAFFSGMAITAAFILGVFIHNSIKNMR
jgi:hypothetical protein